MVRLSSEEARQLAYTTILAQISEGVIVTDAVGTIIFVNDAAAAIHGMARLDVRPNAYSQTYHLYREDGRTYPSEELPLARAVRGDIVNNARWLIRRPDHREVLAEGTAQPLRTANGRRVGAVLTLRDITAHDAAERCVRMGALARERTDHSIAATPNEAARKIKSALQEIIAQAGQIGEAAPLSEARRHGRHIQTTATALLALVDTLLGGAAPAPQSAASSGGQAQTSARG